MREEKLKFLYLVKSQQCTVTERSSLSSQQLRKQVVDPTHKYNTSSVTNSTLFLLPPFLSP